MEKSNLCNYGLSVYVDYIPLEEVLYGTMSKNRIISVFDLNMVLNKSVSWGKKRTSF